MTKEEKAAKAKKYYEANKDSIRKQRNDYNAVNREKLRRQHNESNARRKNRVKEYSDTHKKQAADAGRKHKYNMSPEDYDALLSVQQFKCASCGSEKKLDVEHDHNTGKIRGLVCRVCNLAARVLEDSKLVGNVTAFLSKQNKYNRTSTGLKSLHGLTREELTFLKEQQQGKCECCGAEKQLDIDHNHTTGDVRGLVCRRCNLAIAIIENKELSGNVMCFLDKNKEIVPST